jgi:hypothetical protein
VGERLSGRQEVGGSTPLISTILYHILKVENVGKKSLQRLKKNL